MWPFALLLSFNLIKVAGYSILNRIARVGVRKKRSAAGIPFTPSVDILLPMFNEEKVVVKTIRNLLEAKYAHFSIIVVDDGSSDKSYELVQTHFGSHPSVRLIRQPNAGKSAALNAAMIASDSEILVTIDADTWIRPDAIQNIVYPFRDERVAAVAGHIKVGNRVNLLTDMQYFEYIAIWDNDRELFDAFNGILVVPGALGAFRRSAVDAVGNFKTEAIAEDTDLTLRLLQGDYVIRNAINAVSYTEAPDNLKMFFRQRVRWTTGLSQGLLRYNKKLWTTPNRVLSFVALPYTWILRIVLPFLLPLADYYFLYAYFVLRRYDLLFWWLSWVLSEAIINLYLLVRNHERINIFKLIALQRLYKHLLFVNYWVIFSRRLGGTLFIWRKITRKGNIRIDNEAHRVSRRSELK